MITTRTKGHRTLAASDVAVVAAGASAITTPLWTPLVEWVPQIAQGMIVAGTLVFVVARAVNEVLKFIRESRAQREKDG